MIILDFVCLAKQTSCFNVQDNVVIDIIQNWISVYIPQFRAYFLMFIDRRFFGTISRICALYRHIS